MLVTFGATFFGVISSFLLWYVGQWWLKRRKDQKTVKHIVREIHEQIAGNIEMLGFLSEDVPKMISEGEIPIFLPYRLNLSVHRYLTSSGELRLLDVSQQRWILDAGMASERFNKFIDNTELVITLALGLPNGRKIAKHRLVGLVEAARGRAESLNVILGKI